MTETKLKILSLNAGAYEIVRVTDPHGRVTFDPLAVVLFNAGNQYQLRLYQFQQSGRGSSPTELHHMASLIDNYWPDAVWI